METIDYISEGTRMVEAFANVGVSRFDLTRTTLSKEARGYWPARSHSQVRALLPSLIETSVREQWNLIVRPHVDPPSFLVQLDDISGSRLERVWSLAFLVIRTSPGRYQAWLAVEGCDAGLCQRVKKAAGGDLGANGWVRLAGSFNVKLQYAPTFPIVRVVVVRPGLKVAPATLHVRGLMADSRVASFPPAGGDGHRPRPRRFPDYGRCLDGAPVRADGEKDRSLADFTWCCTAIRWGWSSEEAAGQLGLEPLSKAAERGRQYARHTAEKAAAAVAGRSIA
jgi:hypothetical protein